MNYTVIRSDELSHHGVLGMKWGVRRYQNEDGSLTPAGAKRYGIDSSGHLYKKNIHDRAAEASRRDAEDLKKHGYSEEAKAVEKVAKKQQEKANIYRVKGTDKKISTIKKAAGIGAGVSVLATIKNAVGAEIFTQALSDGALHINMGEVIGKGAVKAGQVALSAALLTAGAYAIKDIVDNNKENNGLWRESIVDNNKENRNRRT